MRALLNFKISRDTLAFFLKMQLLEFLINVDGGQRGRWIDSLARDF
jgi:hypothetical protein